MVEELLGGYNSGEFDLHDDHHIFLEELALYLDPYLPMIEQKSDNEIILLHWLYEWKCNQNFTKYDDFKEEYSQ